MPLQIPHPEIPLHLYRHLLRESTYLPTLCRPWIVSRIQQRFRDCRHKSPATRHVANAHASLRYLRSANAGNSQRLEHLCFMATGRVGKRRRILAASQLARTPPADTSALEQSRIDSTLTSSSLPTAAAAAAAATPAVDAASPPNPQHDWLDNWSLEMIDALSRSQVAQQVRDWPQNMRRALNTKHITTGTNCFGRPFRPKLVRRKLKKHWASVLMQLLPPLPRGEWDHLAYLVRADLSADELQIPLRRPVARHAQAGDSNAANEPWDWTQHVLKPARVIERGSSRRQKTLSGKEDQDPRGHGNPIGVRVMNPRMLQRMYGRIWSMSPVMEKRLGKQPGTYKWSVKWGTNEQKFSTPLSKAHSFFQGVANDGTVLKAPSQG